MCVTDTPLAATRIAKPIAIPIAIVGPRPVPNPVRHQLCTGSVTNRMHYVHDAVLMSVPAQYCTATELRCLLRACLGPARTSPQLEAPQVAARSRLGHLRASGSDYTME